MNLKRTTLFTFLSVCLIVFIVVCLSTPSAIASVNSTSSSHANHYFADSTINNTLATRKPDVGTSSPATDKKSAMTIIHESADILHYEDGAPYIHDILTNNTDKTIAETQYCMLAYNENGLPLKLYWNFLDSSAKSSFENVVQRKADILPNETENYRGGWSLYNDELGENISNDEADKPSQAAYTLLCIKQIVFEDGTVWENPNYENWLKTYSGNEIDIDELQNYYPYEYTINLD